MPSALQVVFYVGVQLDITKRGDASEAAAGADKVPSQHKVVPGEPSGKDVIAQRGGLRGCARGLPGALPLWPAAFPGLPVPLAAVHGQPKTLELAGGEVQEPMSSALRPLVYALI